MSKVHIFIFVAQNILVNVRRNQFMASMEVLKVSSTSQPKAVAGAIAAVLRNGNPVEIQAIGAGAVNQAVKSIAVARGYVAPNGIDLVTIPAFFQLEVNGETKTSIKFIIEKR